MMDTSKDAQAGEDTMPSLPAPGQSGGLDALIATEGLNLSFPDLKKRSVRRRKVEKRKEELVDDSDMRSLLRLSKHSLFLLVRYTSGTHWCFPKADRIHGQAMRETLLRLCSRQLGPQLNPYLVGACPFTYLKKRSQGHPGIEGRKIFYYRGRLIPGSDVVLPSDSPVVDWKWCSEEELPRFMGTSEWCTVRDCLPL